MAATKIRAEQLSSTILSFYPIGYVYISTVSTSPATLFGGTWSAFATGRTLVSLDSGQTEFDVVEETGGVKTVTLSTAELASHVHSCNPGNKTSSGQSATHAHSFNYRSGTVSTGSGSVANWKQGPNAQTSGNVSVGHTHDWNIAAFDSGSTGGGGAHNNVQPYIVTYMWKRTA